MKKTIPKIEKISDNFINYYEYQQKNINNISNWFPFIDNCGIKTPKTIIIKVPIHIAKCFFMDNKEEDIKIIMDWVEKEVMPKIPEGMIFLFIKNGTFSDKFDFKNCIPMKNILEITNSIIKINYSSLMVGAGGITEICIRERIKTVDKLIPTIYNGLPLNDEYRVFYDFDNKKVLYIAEYWNKEYCFKSISRNISDKIIFENWYDFINEQYEKNKDSVVAMVEKAMQNTGMKGKWSIDILRNCYNEFFLIDMAKAENSAYWSDDCI